MPLAVIAFGSNLGDREGFLAEAFAKLSPTLSDMRISSLYETEPMYVVDQPSFLNGVLSGQTELGPLALLQRLKSLESEIGRQSRIDKGAREIDLDLIAYGSLVLKSAKLNIPHPLAAERRFVLEPLYEIHPEFELIGYGKVVDCVHTMEVQSQMVMKRIDAPVQF